jgi:hypothetical protein
MASVCRWFALFGLLAFGIGVGWEQFRESLANRELPSGMILEYRTFQAAAWLSRFGATLFLVAVLAGILGLFTSGLIGLLRRRRNG